MQNGPTVIRFVHFYYEVTNSSVEVKVMHKHMCGKCSGEVNSLTSVNDQHRISPYSINTISTG